MNLLKILCVSFLLHTTFAHPVSYGKSLSLISKSGKDKRENVIHYSPTFRYSLGAKQLSKDRAEATILRAGLLLKRWNTPHSQANIYSTFGVGKLKSKSSLLSDQGLYSGHIHADWESRRYFVMGMYERYEGSDNFLDDEYTFKLGFAPYLAEYDELNIWLMFKQTYMPRDKDRFRSTPLLRMYYKNVLWELGAPTDDGVMFNFSVRLFI